MQQFKKDTKIVSIYIIKSPRFSINTIRIYFDIITNEGEDDLSSTGDGVGNAGKRIACGIISQTVGEFMDHLIMYLFELNV